jgi:hypothetical protein
MRKLLASVAVIAGIAGVAQAEDIRVTGGHQTTKNTGRVDNTGAVIIQGAEYSDGGYYYWGHQRLKINGSVNGDGATLAVAATGATSPVSGSTINTNSSIHIGRVGQRTHNSGNVSNLGVVTTGSVTGNGTSSVVAATGASSAVSASIVK